MAFCCRDCKIIYPRKYPNCPKCGISLFTDSRSEAELISAGYSHHRSRQAAGAGSAGENTTNQTQRSDSTVKVTIDSNDTLDQLRRDFLKSSHSNHGTSASSGGHTTAADANVGSSTGTGTASNDTTSNFFSDPTASSYRINTCSRNDPEQRPFLFEDTSTPPRTYRTRHARTPVQIPWRTISRLLIFALIIFCLIAIWNARFAILNGIWSFLVSLLPAALVIGVIVYIIRSFFK